MVYTVQPFQTAILTLSIIGTVLFLIGAAIGAGAQTSDSERAIIARVLWGAAACAFTSVITILATT